MMGTGSPRYFYRFMLQLDWALLTVQLLLRDKLNMPILTLAKRAALARDEVYTRLKTRARFQERLERERLRPPCMKRSAEERGTGSESHSPTMRATRKMCQGCHNLQERKAGMHGFAAVSVILLAQCENVDPD